ncbi:hypothetical protein QQ045_023411 [Rhodiola kirilowii]
MAVAQKGYYSRRFRIRIDISGVRDEQGKIVACALSYHNGSTLVVSQRRKETKWKKNLKYSRRKRLSQIKNKQEKKGVEAGGKAADSINKNSNPPIERTEEELREKGGSNINLQTSKEVGIRRVGAGQRDDSTIDQFGIIG